MHREQNAAVLAPELLARVQQIHVRTHRLVSTALAGGYRSTFRGSGLEFEEVRPYQPGDDVRSIDWNVTARAGEAYVKSFREERELTLNLVIDSGPSMDFGSHGWSKREAAAQVVGVRGRGGGGVDDSISKARSSFLRRAKEEKGVDVYSEASSSSDNKLRPIHRALDRMGLAP